MLGSIDKRTIAAVAAATAVAYLVWKRHSKRLSVSCNPLALSDVVFGGSWLALVNGTESGQDVADAAVKAAVRAGIKKFDTAPLYGGGVREQRLGAALVKLAPSELANVQVTTKTGRLLRNGAPTNDYTAAGAATSLKESLDRMGLERVHGLRIHDCNDTPERDPKVDEVAIALGPGGMLEGLTAMRRAGKISKVSLGMNSQVQNRVPGDFPLPPSVIGGVPAEIVRLVQSAPAGTFDEALIAGGWTLMDQSGMHALIECERHGIPVLAAGIFNSGLLVGGSTMLYCPATSEEKSRAQAWKSLAGEHGLSLPAVAIAFAYLPSIVKGVVIGLSTADQVATTVSAVEESRKVPVALWYEARKRGLLSSHVPLP